MSEITPPPPDELRALTRLGFGELGAAASGIGQMHAAIAGRVFRPLTAVLGPIPKLVETVHGTASAGVYAGLRGATTAAGRAAERAVPARRALSASPRGAAALAALNGLIGDELERKGSALQQPMAARVGGEPILLETDALTAAFPDAGPRIVVFLHGLMETEFAWRLGGQPTYGERLAEDLGLTPVYVRYNTGRHVSENGRSLADLMAALVAAWPVTVQSIALVGHSMGGLVARSACHQAALDELPWAKRVRHVVTVGTPHMGAPLEQAVHMASAALGALPETQPFAAFLRRRSSGIRDLRQGSLVDDDWRDCNRDALRARACQEVPLLEGATHCFVSATVTRSARHPLGRLLGDTLVLVPSASGRSRTRRIPFRDEDGFHVGGTNHLALLNHPAVYAQLRDWLSTSPKELTAGSRS